MTIPVWEVIVQVAAFPEIENGDMVDQICAEGFQILADGLGTLDLMIQKMHKGQTDMVFRQGGQKPFDAFTIAGINDLRNFKP